jgi:hypothetical protein
MKYFDRIRRLFANKKQCISFAVLIIIAYGTAYICKFHISNPPVLAIIFMLSFGSLSNDKYFLLKKICLFILGFLVGMVLELLLREG